MGCVHVCCMRATLLDRKMAYCHALHVLNSLIKINELTLSIECSYLHQTCFKRLASDVHVSYPDKLWLKSDCVQKDVCMQQAVCICPSALQSSVSSSKHLPELHELMHGSLSGL